MILVHKLDLDIVKMYHPTRNEVSISSFKSYRPNEQTDRHTQYVNIAFPHTQAVNIRMGCIPGANRLDPPVNSQCYLITQVKPCEVIFMR